MLKHHWRHEDEDLRRYVDEPRMSFDRCIYCRLYRVRAKTGYGWRTAYGLKPYDWEKWSYRRPECSGDPLLNALKREANKNVVDNRA